MPQPKYNFKGLSLDVSTKEKMQDKYPHLSILFADCGLSTVLLDKAIRYMCYAYDPASPLIKNIADLKIRRADAAKRAGLDNPHVVSMDMVLDFLKNIVKCREWTLLVATEECFDEYIELLMQPISEKYVLQPIADDEDEEGQDTNNKQSSSQLKKRGSDSADEQKKVIEGAQKKALLRGECSKMLIEIAEHKRVLFEGDIDLEQAYESKRHTPESIATAKQ